MAELQPQASSIEAHALARHVRMSPQKARLVMDLIRGQKAQAALQTLRFTPKRAAKHIEKVLRSAIANAERKAEDAGAPLDVDELYVNNCFVNEGTRWKRLRPAPMGRAFRYQKRTAHLWVGVAEHYVAAAQCVAAIEAEAEAQKGVRGTSHAPLRLGFRFDGSHALRCGDMMLRDAYPKMRGALLIAECATHRRGTQPLPARAFVHEAGVYEQFVDIERCARILRLAFGVADRAAQNFFDVLGRALGRVAQRLQRRLRLLPADQVHHQTRLLRRHPHMAGQRVGLNCAVLWL